MEEAKCKGGVEKCGSVETVWFLWVGGEGDVPLKPLALTLFRKASCTYRSCGGGGKVGKN